MATQQHYSGIGKSITMRFDTSDLSKRDQVALCCDLMRDIGITDVLFEGLTQADSQMLNRTFETAIKKFLGE